MWSYNNNLKKEKKNSCQTKINPYGLPHKLANIIVLQGIKSNIY